MKTKEEKKAFAMAQLIPYFKDPSTCGFDENGCVYLTKDGKMCVAGKNMLNPENFDGPITMYLLTLSQKEVFKSEAVDVLNLKEWFNIQYIHDSIAMKELENIKKGIESLGLFTYEELLEAVNLL